MGKKYRPTRGTFFDEMALLGFQWRQFIRLLARPIFGRWHDRYFARHGFAIWINHPTTGVRLWNGL